jgi:hypothetical protein
MSDSRITAPKIKRTVVAHRIVQAGLFVTLVWKWSYFQLSAEVYADIPLDDPFFPAWLRSVYTVSLAYLLTVAAIVISFGTASRPVQRLCSWVTFIGATILCVHQGSYNDMTFVTAWWVSLWSLWYVHRDWEEDAETLLRRAAFLARLIISVIVLGGAIGKWTAEYWSGEVFYDIYFRDRDFWVFNILRSNFEADTLRQIAMWYSRQVILVETMVGVGLWLLPARWAAIAGIFVLMSIALLSNFLLFSVLSCLIGLSAVGLFVSHNDTVKSDDR